MISCAECDLLLGMCFVISVAFQISEDYMCLLVCVIMPIMNLVSILCYNYDGSEGGSFQPLFFF